jgi:tRNA pseudouridine32 synthase / 23S rRNA pseudouridine746 synthase
MTNDKQPLTILYQDEALLAINKSAGLLTLPDGYNRAAPCLIDLLKQQPGRVWVVHRLDRDTSGVIVFARTADVHRALNIAFDSREVHKVYHAIVIGVPEWDERLIDLPLRPDGDRRHRTVIEAKHGKPAVTRARVLERFARHTLIEARPETGRTHQIRAHLAALDLPLAGDVLYGDQDAAALIQRTALHAHSIEFTHPVTRKSVRLSAPYPEDFTLALAQLRGQ